MIIISTVRDHLEGGYRITVHRPTCRRSMDDYPLHRLVMRGKGDKSLSKVRLRHQVCGTKLEIRRIPPLANAALNVWRRG